ncbi:hypothetical protein [Methylobacterium oryzisoli]|uniref:hypothetical protein n=1 Tax=Methylobacterium oryzisoli TaxID=3385502 RepID=UPI00389231A8
MDDKRALPRAKPGQVVRVADGAPFIGVRTRFKGREVLGLKRDCLDRVLGRDEVQALVQWMHDQGLIEGGHGSRNGSQLPVSIELNGTQVAKPRLLVVDPVRLAEQIEAAR